MTSFVTRTLDAMSSRRTVSDRDRGELAHAVFTFPGETGPCFEVTAAGAWVSSCGPATDQVLQLRPVGVSGEFGGAGEAFTVLAGLVTPEVTRVAVEFSGSEVIDVELVEIGSEGLLAWASPVVRDHLDAVVAYDGEQEVARASVDGSS